MTLSNWLEVLAVFLSPLIALRVGKLLDSLSDAKRRKEEIFNTLMETRAQPLTYEHVRALNKIDIAFYKNKEVRSAWNTYRDHLNSSRGDNETDQKIWADKIPDKMAKLLMEMAKLLNYDFDEVLLKKGAYLPVAHGNLEMEQNVLRQGLVEVFALKRPLSIKLVTEETTASTSVTQHNNKGSSPVS